MLKVRAGPEQGVTKRPNLLMTAGIGLAQRDEKKELLYGLMGAPLSPNPQQNIP